SIWDYVNRIAFYSSIKKEGAKTLICGLGGGILAKEFDNMGFDVDVVELDPDMKPIARKYFHLSKDIPVHIDDARHFINNIEKEYDIIVFDMLAGERPPTNAYTLETFKKIKKRLKNEGLFFFHYQSTMYNNGLKAIRSLMKTMDSSGLSVKLLKNGKRKDKVLQRMFMASPSDKFQDQGYFKKVRAPEYYFPVKDMFIEINTKNGVLLTDERPIFEFIHMPIMRKVRKKNRDAVVEGLIEREMNFY
ncbi:MAG: spermidine synthase, partial [Flavobacteriales bacterium]